MPLRPDFATLYNKVPRRNRAQPAPSAAIGRHGMPFCVLWIDEIEKALATDGGDSDGGVQRRARHAAHLAFWNARRSVSLVALPLTTHHRPAAGIAARGPPTKSSSSTQPLPPARVEIFSIHPVPPPTRSDIFDLRQLAEVADGFAGAGRSNRPRFFALRVVIASKSSRSPLPVNRRTAAHAAAVRRHG